MSINVRVHSFSLDQLRVATTVSVGIDEVAERVVDLPDAEEQAQSSNEPETKTKVVPRRRDIGAFQQLPVVSPGCEILGTALRRAKMTKPTKGVPLTVVRLTVLSGVKVFGFQDLGLQDFKI